MKNVALYDLPFDPPIHIFRLFFRLFSKPLQKTTRLGDAMVDTMVDTIVWLDDNDGVGEKVCLTGDHVIWELGLLGAADHDDVIEIYFFFSENRKNSVSVVQGKR